MNNSHDEIKQLLKASRTLLSNSTLTEDISNIRKQYNVITEEGINLTGSDVTKKYDVAQSVDDKIEDDTEPKDDKSQAYRISGGVLVLHGKEQTDLELTTDEKIAFQETMEEFISEVSDLVDFNKLNLYPNNVEWSGKIIDFDIEFLFSIGEESGIYINGDMIKVDDKFLDMLTHLKSFYEKFSSKWSKVLASRKKTIKTTE
jgi:hypothetical protein